MKSFVIALLFAFSLTFICYGQYDGLRFGKDWKEYSKAVSADLPRTADAVLLRIEKKARQVKSYPDLLKALSLLDDESLIRECLTQLQKEDLPGFMALAFGLPSRMVPDDTLVSYLRRYGERLKGVPADETLAAVTNSGNKDMKAVLGGYVDCYEMFAWKVSHRDTIIRDALYSYLEAAGEDYFLNLVHLKCSSVRNASKVEYERILEECASREDAALLPKAMILGIEYASLKTVDQCVDFDRRAENLKAMLEAAASAKGLPEYHKWLFRQRADVVEGYRKSLREKSLQVSDLAIATYPSEGYVDFIVRNSMAVEVRITSEDGYRWTTRADNPSGGFGTGCKVRVETPRLNDGKYTLMASLADDSRHFLEFDMEIASLAVSVRDGKYYLTHAQSGAPVDSADVFVKKVGDTDYSLCGSMSFDGFTPLPVIPDTYSALRFMTKDGLSSATVYCCGRADISTEDNLNKQVVAGDIFLSKKIFRRGEDVAFKIILYGSAGRDISAQEGVPTEVNLYGPGWKKIDSTVMITNAFGSASGKFSIPAEALSGSYCIEIPGRSTEYFRVEDYELADFTMDFVPFEGIYVPGETMCLKGKISSFSNFPTGGITVRYSYAGVVSETMTASDGSFEVPLTYAKGYIEVDAVALAPNGETLRASHGVYSDGFSASARIDFADIENAVWGGAGACVREDTLAFRVDVVNLDNVPQKGLALEGDLFRITPRDTVHVRSLPVHSGEDTRLVLGNLESGSYMISVKLGIGGAERHFTSTFTYLREGQKSFPDMQGNYIFLPQGEGYIFGAKDTLWVLSERYNSFTGELIDMEHMMFVPGMHTVEQVCDNGCNIMLSLLFVKDGHDYTVRQRYRPASADYGIEMRVSSFRDRTSNGTQENFEICFTPGENVEVLVDIFDAASEEISPNVYSFTPEGILSGGHIPYSSTSFGYVCRRFPMAKSFMDSRISYADDSLGAQSNEAFEASVANDMGPGRRLRSDFGDVLSFQPHLTAGKDGTVRVRFETTDRLSTFVVQILAHDSRMRHVLHRGNLVVSKDFMVAASVPGFVRDGDCVRMEISASNLSSSAVCGRFALALTDASSGKEICRSYSDIVTVAPHSRASYVSKPMELSSECGAYYVRFWFETDQGATLLDGEEHMLSVLPASREYVRAVTAVTSQDGLCELDLSALNGNAEDMCHMEVSEPLISALRSVPCLTSEPGQSLVEWVNALTVMRMMERLMADHGTIKDILASELNEAHGIPSACGLWNRYAVTDSLSRAVLDSLLDASWRDRFAENALKHISDCVLPDGSMSWFKGGQPSRYVTLMALGRYAAARKYGAVISPQEARIISSAVKCLDGIFADHLRKACSGISWRLYSNTRFVHDSFVHDYMYVRSFFRNSVPFVHDAGKYYDKCETLMAKKHSEVSVGTKVKFARTLLNDSRYAHSRAMTAIINSLYEHALKDSAGNWYFPQQELAGVFGGELFVNAQALELFSKMTDPRALELKDGIRRHLLMLKDGMSWGSSVQNADVISAIMATASEEELDGLNVNGFWNMEFSAVQIDSVIAGGGKLALNFGNGGFRTVTMFRHSLERESQIAPFANGLSVTREFFRKEHGSQQLMPLSEGESIARGDIIVCRYVVKSDFARSFVRLRAMRPGGFAVAELRSGYTYIRGALLSGYRDIRQSYTDYYFDEIPAGEFVVEESFHAVCSGNFSAGLLEIESCYNPQYRGNAAEENIKIFD